MNWNLFAVACIGIGITHLVVASVLRMVVRGTREHGLVADGERSPYELAELHGGLVCVATAAAASLYAAGRLIVRDDTIAATGRLRGEVAPIERELFEALGRDPGMRARSVPRALRRGAAHVQLVAPLRTAGLLPAASVATLLRRLRALAWVYVPLVVLATVSADRPASEHAGVGAMLLSAEAALLLMPLIALIVGRGAETATQRGRSVLEQHRDRFRHLSSGHVRDRDLALAVALFGSEPLRQTYPDFARAWGIVSPEEAQLEAALIG